MKGGSVIKVSEHGDDIYECIDQMMHRFAQKLKNYNRIQSRKQIEILQKKLMNKNNNNDENENYE